VEQEAECNETLIKLLRDEGCENCSLVELAHNSIQQLALALLTLKLQACSCHPTQPNAVSMLYFFFILTHMSIVSKSVVTSNGTPVYLRGAANIQKPV
jgi:hypothetical protein